MNGKDSELSLHLLETFKVEAREHVAAISACLMELERSTDAGNAETALETIYRSAHSLKGGARIVNLSLVEYLCQSLEECLAAVRRAERRLTPPLLDLLHETTAVIENILLSPSPHAPVTSLKSSAIRLRQRLDEAGRPDASPIVNESATTDDGKKSAASSVADHAGSSPSCAPMKEEPAPPPPDSSAPSRFRPAAASETVRVPAIRLDELMLKAEEMISCKLALQEHNRRVREMGERLALFRRELSGTDFLDRNSILEMDRGLAVLSHNLASLRRSMEENHRQASAMLENLIDDAKTLLLFPFSSLTDGFARQVRELAREQGKEIELRLAGEGIELDRRILQELRDPLVHLLRNCIDHGIETAAERRAADKPPRALIRIGAVSIDNGKVEISVRDDGRGIEADAIRAAAVRLGLFSKDEAAALSDATSLQLMFRSGLSTRREVSAISGRGLGLAIAAERVEKLGGTIGVESVPGVGTVFRMLIPLSLATFRGIQLRIGERIFAIPTLNVVKVCRVRPDELKTVGNRETLVVEQQTVPVASLASILGVHSDQAGESGFLTLMLLGAGKELVAFRVDEVIGEDDLLVKGLGPQLVRVRNISGATVLGNGAVVPILNSADLLKSAFGGHALRLAPVAEGVTSHRGRAPYRILVVDDSITSRTLIKNVLESYGYDVTTAIDGFDAMTALQESHFDLVSSDVEMPRMDGFELTARIRADERFSRLPVVLVTGMDSAEDRKKGINAGADAYIVKSSFDQGNLLDTIRKLI